MNKSKIIVTAGGTSEHIDKVRKITNSSSGKLGLAIVNELLETREDVETIFYICSHKSEKPNNPKVKIIEIEGTMDLKQVVEKILTTEKIDYFIHSMAVSDYMVKNVTNSKLLAESIREQNTENIEESIKNNQKIITSSKISSNEQNLIIMLEPTPKIISVIKKISPETCLVGFKLLDGVGEEELIEVATKLREKNNCELVVANDLENIRRGNHKAFIIDRNGEKIIANGKEDIAKKLVRRMYND